MYTKTVRLPYTLWWDGKDKTFRMDMSSILPEEHYEDGKKYIGKIRNVQVGGYNVDGDIHPPKAEDNGYKDVSEFATAVYNEQKHYVDITLKSFPSFNADGEIALYIDYELAEGIEEYLTDYSYKKEEVHIIIPIRSHENPSKDPGQFNNGIGIDKLDARNGFAHTVGASEEPIVFSFELIKRDITDEFITNGQALDMVKNKAVENAVLSANDTGLGISLNYKSFDKLSWDTLKQYLGDSNSTEYTPPTLDEIINSWYNADNSRKSDFANAVGSKMTLSVRENSTKDIEVYVVQDIMSLNGQPTKSYSLLFTVPRSFLGGEGQSVNTEELKNSILNTITQQLPNVASLKSDILSEVDSKIPSSESIINTIINTNFLKKAMDRGTISANDINQLLLNGPDESNGVTHTILENTTTWNKHVQFIKRDDHYEVAYYADDIYPRPLLTIPFSSLREVSGGSSTFNSYSLDQLLETLSNTTNGIKEDLFGKLLLNASFSLEKDAGDLKVKWTKSNGDSHTILSFRYENVVDEPTIKHFVNEGTKDFYTKAEVDSLIQQLRQELTAGTHTEEHPQQ